MFSALKATCGEYGYIFVISHIVVVIGLVIAIAGIMVINIKNKRGS